MRHETCPSCASNRLRAFFRVNSAPVFSLVTVKSKEEALAVPRKDIELALCLQCGFIFNRLWAAVKRETLTILAEGVSTPEEIDSMWSEMFVKGGSLPCKTMDGKYFLSKALWHLLIRRQLSASIP